MQAPLSKTYGATQEVANYAGLVNCNFSSNRFLMPHPYELFKTLFLIDKNT